MNGFAKAYVLCLAVCSVFLCGQSLRAEDTVDLNPELRSAITQYANLYTGPQGPATGSSGMSVAKIIAWILFNAVGFVAFAYGKKMASLKPLVIGGLLIAYPYFVPDTLWLYAVGVGLSAALYFWRD